MYKVDDYKNELKNKTTSCNGCGLFSKGKYAAVIYVLLKGISVFCMQDTIGL
ncbi:protein of unknown function [Tenacibaculum sp. 190524A02b]|uniref:Uncharacterized protein n=1 Tax=Tenacibaculum vairaonense TaxID=3137860 RepID=A0ABM9PN22_9FLAO